MKSNILAMTRVDKILAVVVIIVVTIFMILPTVIYFKLLEKQTAVFLSSRKFYDELESSTVFDQIESSTRDHAIALRYDIDFAFGASNEFFFTYITILVLVFMLWIFFVWRVTRMIFRSTPL